MAKLSTAKKLKLRTARDVLTLIWRAGFVAPSDQRRFHKVTTKMFDELATERYIRHDAATTIETGK